MIRNRELLAIKASAGSGKTFALTLRYIELLLEGVAPPSILAITFTKKASYEMQKRILSALKELTNTPHKSPYFAELLKRDASYEKKILQGGMAAILKKYIVSKKNITTIDSFFNAILTKFCFYGNLRYGYTFSDIEYKYVNNMFLEHLDNAELQRLSNVISTHGISLERFLGYMQDLVYKEPEFKITSASSDVSGAKNALLAYANALTKDLANENLTEHQKKQLHFDSIEELLGKTWMSRETLGEYQYFKKIATPAYEERFVYLKTLVVRYYEELQKEILSIFSEFFEQYKQARIRYLREKNSISFNDMSLETFSLMRGDFLSTDFLYFRLDSRLEHVLIDEFQDTSMLQYLVLKPIIDEIRAGIGQKEFRSLFFVGDTKQSIYRFRGAQSKLFEELLKDEELNLAEERLNVNYRSKTNIVTFINTTFRDKIPDYFDQHSPEDGAYDGGYVLVEESEDIALSCAQKVAALIESGVHSEEIAVLTFTNDATLEIEEEIHRLDPTIPISTESTLKVVAQNENAAIISLLKYAVLQEDIYLAAFYARMGESPHNKKKIPVDISLPLEQLIFSIAHRYSLLCEGVYKLIERSMAYEDIFDFVFNIDQDPATISSSGAKGVRMMTIHKSKGLDFPYLIVADKIGKENNTGDFFVDDREGLKLRGINVRFGGRKKVDSHFAQLLEREEEAKKEDLLHQLYVAFTRGKEALIVIKNKEKSVFDILQLEETLIGSIENDRSSTEKANMCHAEVNELSGLGRQFDFLTRSEKKKTPNPHSLYFGEALHTVLEYCDFKSKDWSLGLQAAKNRFGFLLKKSDFDEIERRVATLLSDKKFITLLEGEIFREYPIVQDGKRGFIDLLIVQTNKAVVIDYKSSLGFKEKLKEQLLFYKDFLKAEGFSRIEGYFCHLAPEGVTLISV